MNYLKEVMVRILDFFFFLNGFSFLIFSCLIQRKKKISIFDTVLLFNDNSRVDRDKLIAIG